MIDSTLFGSHTGSSFLSFSFSLSLSLTSQYFAFLNCHNVWLLKIEMLGAEREQTWWYEPGRDGASGWLVGWGGGW